MEPEPSAEDAKDFAPPKRVSRFDVPASRRPESLAVEDIELDADRGPLGGTYVVWVVDGDAGPTSADCRHFGSASGGWQDTLDVMALAPEDMPLRADLLRYFEAVAYASVFHRNRFLEKLDRSDPWQHYFALQVAFAEQPRMQGVAPMEQVEEARALYLQDPGAPYASDLLELGVLGDGVGEFAQHVFALGDVGRSEQVSRMVFCDGRQLEQLSAEQLRMAVRHRPAGEPNLLVAALSRAAELEDEALTAALLTPAWNFVNHLDADPACNTTEPDELRGCWGMRDTLSGLLEQLGRTDVMPFEHVVRRSVLACPSTGPREAMAASFDEEGWGFEWFSEPDESFASCVEDALTSLAIPDDAVAVQVFLTSPNKAAPKGVPYRRLQTEQDLSRAAAEWRRSLSNAATEP